MNNCRRMERWLQLYTDGRLEAERLPALEVHLAGCMACRELLAAYELIGTAAGAHEEAAVPPGLTGLIMARVADYERARLAAVERRFAPRWGDAVLAVTLATLSTLLFVLLDPALRMTVPRAVAQSFPLVPAMLAARGPGAIAWSAWVVWIASGLGLTLWLAGPELRAAARYRLTQSIARLPAIWEA
ncbi:MAG TPA: zf-HC2 domain-containing protein [Ktedonobacterales bacterium]|nr:zf-HC2 domain-containing protein [Ktedonobacterales bacterium]